MIKSAVGKCTLRRRLCQHNLIHLVSLQLWAGHDEDRPTNAQKTAKRERIGYGSEKAVVRLKRDEVLVEVGEDGDMLLYTGCSSMYKEAIRKGNE